MAVAKGAAIYAAHMLDLRLVEAGEPPKHTGLWDHIEIEEVTAHELGLEFEGGFLRVIGDNEPTPRTRTKLFEPTALSPDERTAKLDPIKIAQGNKNDYAIVGEVALEDIFTHGRKLEDITISVRFKADRNLIGVRVEVERGDKDGSLYVREGELRLGQGAPPDPE